MDYGYGDKVDGGLGVSVSTRLLGFCFDFRYYLLGVSACCPWSAFRCAPIAYLGLSFCLLGNPSQSLHHCYVCHYLVETVRTHCRCTCSASREALGRSVRAALHRVLYTTRLKPQLLDLPPETGSTHLRSYLLASQLEEPREQL